MASMPVLAAAVFAALSMQTPAQIPLWIGGAPGFENRRSEPEEAKDWWVKNVHNPSITAFLPPKEKANGTAVVVVPGGGHSQLVFGPEGVEPAKYLNNLGIACFVLKHRLPREKDSPYKIEVHVRQDIERAMRLVRARATTFGIDPNRLGVLGFSAGGETGAFVAYNDLPGNPSALDPVDRLNARANFFMSIYPGPIGYPSVVPNDAPPAFMLCSYDDEFHAKVIEDIIPKYRAAKVNLEVHLLSGGGHGYNLGNRSNLAAVKSWPQRMADWLSDRGLLKKG
ncbi:alpha/beta hydrolase [bacterium]|nr:MAG: alpha/beta hydrolase [bacterium]